MVMDATPSPQSVGREFVRQYYTLLNKAPNHLHRFYNNHSSFVHGGLDQHNREAAIVVGQKNIHNRIQQLNFRDCHAKISQVDSQATLGDGVVVQVTGELSNDGQPMRRFTQTFVLAAQSPKKYYVHNDIFRYQDFYSDEEVDGESGARSENDEEYQDAENLEAANALQQPAQIFYPLSVVPPLTAPGQTVPIQSFTQAPPQLNGLVHDDVLQGIQNQGNPNNIPVTPVTIQSIPPQQPQEVIIPMEPITAVTPVNLQSNMPTNIPESHDIIESPIPVKQSEITIIQETVTIVEKEPQQEVPSVIEKIEIKEEPKIVASEPKTYANLVKSGVTGFSFATMASSSTPLISGNSSRQNTLSPPPSRYQQSDSRKSDVENSGSGPMPQRSNNRSQNRERRSSNANSQNFGDSHQLFIGNVPHHATEDELRALFSKFGIVADLRIHSKVGPKVPGGRAPPNYGFITYEIPESVQNCLTNTPLFYPDNSPDGQKLNIEEKKRISNMRGNNGPPTRQGGNPGSLGGNPSTNRGGISNQGPPRGGPSSRGGGGGGGRGGFNSNRTERGGTSATRTGGGGGVGGGGSTGGGNTGTLNYTRRQ